MSGGFPISASATEEVNPACQTKLKPSFQKKQNHPSKPNIYQKNIKDNISRNHGSRLAKLYSAVESFE
jgi:hypothetical protein